MKLLHILRAGTHTDSKGQKVTLSEADFEAMAEAYAGRSTLAPLVVGHPKHDDPAFGWVTRLVVDGQNLFAEVDQVPEEMAEHVRAGRYRHVSAALYGPAHASNPTPGAWALRHVGLLGAMPPAVKELEPVELSEDEEYIELADGHLASTMSRMLRKLRDWLIEESGLDRADGIVPEWLIEDMQHAAARSDEQAATAFSEAPSHEIQHPEIMTDTPTAKQVDPADDRAAEFAERETALSAREQELQEREARIAEQEAAAERARHLEFAERLVATGRILPRHQAVVVESLIQLATATDGLVEFGEGDSSEQVPAVDAFQRFLEELPQQVEFGEVSKAEGDDPAKVDVNDPHALARAAVEFQEAEAAKGHTVSISQAIEAVKAR